MKHFLNLAIIIFLINCRVNSQDPSFPITNYTTRNYGKDFNPANRAIVQDHRGIIYAANGLRLLEYDGHTWNSYPINKETWILSLDVDSAGVIYAGAQNEFGFFAPDQKGDLKYKSLSDSLRNSKDFTNIWKVHAFSGGIVFQAEEKLFLFRKGITKVINPETSFHTSFDVNDKIYVRERGIGLLELNDTALTKVSGSEIFDTTGIFLMVPFGINSKKILIGTQEKGFWIFETGNSTNHFSRFNIDDNQLLEKSKITGGVLIANGFAISTLFNGIIEIDTLGKTKTIINSKHGLNDNDVKQIIPDQSQNLWAALNNGISRIEISSPLSFYSEKSGITGSINTIIRHDKLLYAGTTSGLFVQDKDNDHFAPVPGISVTVWSLVEAGGILVAGTDNGLFQIQAKKIKQFSKERSYSLFYSPELKMLFSGGLKGLTSYTDRSFKKINSLTIEGEDITGIQAEKDKTGTSPELWLGTRYNGIIRIRINNDFTFTSDKYNNSDGLPDGWVIPTLYNSRTVFETGHGLYSFTNENVVKKSLPDSLKNNKDFSKGYFSVLKERDKNVEASVSFVSENNYKIWICFDNKVGYFDKKNNLTFVDQPFMGIETGKINFLYPEEDGICWIGTTDGLIRYDENTGKNYNINYCSLIRKVNFLNNDSTIFMGTNYKKDGDHFKILREQYPDDKITLSYTNNSLRFEFSAPFYEHPAKILYAYKLTNENTGWSQWIKENFHEYTNLHEGKYTFSVKARNVYGKESPETTYSFTILPPWYRSGASYVAYILSAFILFWLFARLYSYRLKKENIRLEGIVSERTAEVVRQNTLLEYQKKEIEDSIRYASRIQSAVIPSDKTCHEIFPESFVVFRPLNIVSGDFYWVSKVGDKTIYTAADCTGHGVPGGFMSMLGIAFLNEIVNKDNITSPDQILNHLREKVIHALQQHGISGEARDGMDIAIVTIDSREARLEYAGAYNPLIMIRNGEITETSGEKMPIGIYEKMHPFTKHEIIINKGDMFYMFSDGYEDQFGGADGKKFKAKRLKNLLLEIHGKSMLTQKEILEETFDEWKGDLPQVDDVVVVGLSIK